jgi:hypothetical protein
VSEDYSEQSRASIRPPQPIQQELLKLAQTATRTAENFASELVQAAETVATGLYLMGERRRHDFTPGERDFIELLIEQTFSFDHTDDVWAPEDAVLSD